MKHKHADLIHAWADGAEIQVFNMYSQEWMDIAFDEGADGTYTVWRSEGRYRIKPEEKKPVVRWLWAYKDCDGGWTWSNSFYTEEECIGADFDIKLEWSRTEFPE